MPRGRFVEGVLPASVTQRSPHQLLLWHFVSSRGEEEGEMSANTTVELVTSPVPSFGIFRLS